MLQPIDIQRIHRIFDPRPDPIAMLRDNVRRKAELDREFDKDLRIIGLGLAAASLWVVVFRIAQMIGVIA